MRIKRVTNNKKAKEEASRLHGNVCLGCGSTENIEWHHVVPLELGGDDCPRNMVPLCTSCHIKITFGKFTERERRAERARGSGNKKREPANCKAVFEDYVRCRIPKSIAADRLDAGNHFPDWYAFKDYLKEYGIEKYYNHLDMILSKNGFVESGKEVGRIEYTDGHIEVLFFGLEKPLTGEFDTHPHPGVRAKRGEHNRIGFRKRKKLEEEEKKKLEEETRAKVESELMEFGLKVCNE